MSELDIIGIGCWSDRFSNFDEFRRGLATGEWPEETVLKPEVIPPRERRRAPHSVKMAVDVMGQACEMAGMAPSEPAVVFSSAMGDMQITDAMCSTLADQPEMVSPTRFHNSVHNAAIGYWSIATGSHQPSTAVAGHDDSGAVGLLEAAVQCGEDKVPVLYVCQEGAAPATLRVIRPSDFSLALSYLMVPAGTASNPLGHMSIECVEHEESGSSTDPGLGLPLDFSGNPTASLLPVHAMLANLSPGQESQQSTCELTLNEHCALRITVNAARSGQ